MPTVAMRQLRQHPALHFASVHQLAEDLDHHHFEQPLDLSGKASAAQTERSKLIVYPDAPHGLTDTHKDRFNQNLLSFLKD